MSGLGGCGQMIVLLAGEGRAWSVDFGLAASRDLDPGDYPLDEGRGSDLFHWPAVRGGSERDGPRSRSRSPPTAAGVAAALERFGTRSWADCIAPAVELSRARVRRRLVRHPQDRFDPRPASRPMTSAAGSIFPTASRPAPSGAGRPPGFGSGASRRPCGGSPRPARATSTRGRSRVRSSPTRSGSGRGWGRRTSPGCRPASGVARHPLRPRHRPCRPRTHRRAEPRRGARAPRRAPRRGGGRPAGDRSGPRRRVRRRPLRRLRRTPRRDRPRPRRPPGRPVLPT